MKIKVVSSLLSCLVMLLTAGCGSNTRVIQARGISYIVPWETSSHDETPAGFNYKGESFAFSEVGGQLTIDGKRYGAVRAGDTVSVLSKGNVLVNGVTRQAE